MNDFAFVKLVFWGLMAFVIVAFLYARRQHRTNSSSSSSPQLSDKTPTPDWVNDLPPVYTAENVHKGQNYLIWCVDTRKSQCFHVREVSGKSIHVRMTDNNGTVCEGWATEIRSDTFLHDHHLLKRIPKEPLAA